MIDSSSDALNRLAVETLEHLRYERELLEQICDRAQALRAVLLKRDNEAVRNEVDRLEPLQQESRRLSTYRQHLAQAISVRLQIPVNRATLVELAKAVDEQRGGELLQVRDELLRLSLKANRLHRANLSIASCFTQLADRLLEALTGKPALARYAKSGRMTTNPAASLFQTEV